MIGMTQVFSRQAYKIYTTSPTGCTVPDDFIKVDYNPPTPTTTVKPIECQAPGITPSLVVLLTTGILRYIC